MRQLRKVVWWVLLQFLCLLGEGHGKVRGNQAVILAGSVPAVSPSSLWRSFADRGPVQNALGITAHTSDCLSLVEAEAMQLRAEWTPLGNQSKEVVKVGNSQGHCALALPPQRSWESCGESTACTRLTCWMSHSSSAARAHLGCTAAGTTGSPGSHSRLTACIAEYLPQEDLRGFREKFVEMDCFCVLVWSSLASRERGSSNIECSGSVHILNGDGWGSAYGYVEPEMVFLFFVVETFGSAPINGRRFQHAAIVLGMDSLACHYS